jgi:alpha-tubulin suppressor-like RCC1 family protein
MPVVIGANGIRFYGNAQTSKYDKYERDTIGTTSNLPNEPTVFTEKIDISSTSAYSTHTTFLDTSGKVYAVGEGGTGQLGSGNTTTISTPAPITYFNTIHISSISAGAGHTIFLDSFGRVYSVGRGEFGQLGRGDTTSISTPAPISYFDTILISSIYAGGLRTMFLDTFGKVYAVGYNVSGQLGRGDTTNISTPEPITYFDIIPISSVSIGEDHTIFLDTTGKVYAVGANGSGRLGLGDETQRTTPVPIPYFDTIPIKYVSAGFSHTIFVDIAGKVYAVGSGGSGELGLGNTTSISTPAPILYFNNIPISSVYAGRDYTIFLDTIGKVYAVGSGGEGRLGFGNTTSISTPAPIPYFNNISIKSVSVTTQNYTIFLDTTGKVHVVGRNTTGQLGLGDTTSILALTPIPYFNITPVSVASTVDDSLANHKLFTLSTTGYYMISFPIFTIVNINNGPDIALNGTYKIIVSVRSSIIPAIGNTLDVIPLSPTVNIASIVIRYHLRKPIVLQKQFTIETAKFPLSKLPTTTPVVTPVDIGVTGYRYLSFKYAGYLTLARDATNLVAWYKMENNQDSSPNGFNLTFRGAAAISTDNGILGNKYLVLDGDNNYADISAGLNIYNVFNNTTTIGGTEIGITFSMWFKATGSGNYARLFEFSNNAEGTNPTEYVLIPREVQTNNIYFQMSSGGIYYTNGINFYDGNWRHICWSIASDNKWYIYIDGIIVSNGEISNPVPNLSYVKQYIGKGGFSSDGYNTGGGVEDFRIYNVGLTATEVLALYNSGFQRSYTVNFPDPDGTECEMLIVGGGGAGGNSIGGGGGAGGVLHITNAVIPYGTYTVSVGKGGDSVSGALLSAAANNGSSSIAFGIEVFGGGFGGAGQWATENKQNGSNGGSGGAGGPTYNAGTTVGGTKTLPNFSSSTITVNSYVYYGGDGGTGYQHVSGGIGANGGGGASGENTSISTAANSNNGGKGADGVQINIDGNNYFWGGGGGGGQFGASLSNKAGDGGKGGGGGGNGSQSTESVGIGGTGGITNGQDGDLEGDGTPTAGSGGAGTGGGGGGCGRTIGSPNAVSGAGGSGIVIIRYKIPTILPIGQWFYNTSDANVYYPTGNVGIGITNPIYALHVDGNTQSTTYSASSKTFKIEHPLKLNKWLYHGCIEGPRFDNIYRGKKLIRQGKAEVDIDRECNTTGGISSGTFPVLNTNSQLFLRNNQTYDRVKGKINGSTISIECENTTDKIEIDWMVVGERHDEHVINTPLTDSDGNLICEHDIS